MQRRTLVASALILLAAAASLRAEVPVAGSLAKPPAKPAAENPCLKYLPDDTVLMGNVDIKTILAWLDSGKEPSAASAMAKQYLMMAQLVTGIDPENEVDYITVYVVGKPQKKDPKFLVVINGSFTINAVEKKLGDQFPDADVTRIGGKNLYTMENGAFCLTEGGTLVLGSPDLVKSAIPKARAKPNLPAALTATLSQTESDTALWLAIKPKAILDMEDLADFRKENTELVTKLEMLDFVSVAVSPVKDGYRLSATTALADKETAATIAEFLAKRKTQLLSTEGVNAFYLPLLLASEIETSDTHVRTSLRLTQTALKELWDTKVVLKK